MNPVEGNFGGVPFYMNLYVFSSANRENIAIGVKRRLWAVSNIDSMSIKRRFTKSQTMLPGSCGILYCSEKGGKCFTVPFRTKSQPLHVDEVVRDVWPEVWALPFEIEPLGPSSRSEPLETARRDWVIFKEVSNVTQITPLGGNYAFNASQISVAGWDEIVKRLGYRDGDIQD